MWSVNVHYQSNSPPEDEMKSTLPSAIPKISTKIHMM